MNQSHADAIRDFLDRWDKSSRFVYVAGVKPHPTSTELDREKFLDPLMQKLYSLADEAEGMRDLYEWMDE
jgi:hypothetical protein